MCKALSHEIVIGGIRLLAKDGGKSSYAVAP
jgi:molybdenum cofactor biosynthesis enzyme